MKDVHEDEDALDEARDSGDGGEGGGNEARYTVKACTKRKITAWILSPARRRRISTNLLYATVTLYVRHFWVEEEEIADSSSSAAENGSGIAATG